MYCDTCENDHEGVCPWDANRRLQFQIDSLHKVINQRNNRIEELESFLDVLSFHLGQQQKLITHYLQGE